MKLAAALVVTLALLPVWAAPADARQAGFRLFDPAAQCNTCVGHVYRIDLASRPDTASVANVHNAFRQASSAAWRVSSFAQISVTP